MGAIKHQEFIADADRLSSRYGSVPVIYVESEEDHYVFGECWFREHLSKVEFTRASTKAPASGCIGVITAVNTERQAGNPAWGIVDRDIVMAQKLWNLVYETDDRNFNAAQPFGSAIKVLCRWEMESYLVDGEALEHFRAASAKQAPRQLSVVYQELYDHCQALIPHAAINAVLHTNNQTGLSDAYTNRFSSRDQVDNDIKSIKLSKLPPSATVDYAQHIAQVDAFDAPLADAKDRVNGLLRRVHGKALLERFHSKNNMPELDGALAKRIEENSRVPAEIENFVSHVISTN